MPRAPRLPKPRTASTDLRYIEVADHVRRLIQRGVLRPGARVPSVRATCRQLKASITTVQAAYRLLERDRLVAARPRSGYFVCFPAPRLTPPAASRPPGRPAMVSVGERGLSLVRSAADARLVPLGAAVPAAELLPVQTLARIGSRVARQCAQTCIQYDQLPGCRRFREQIAQRAVEARCVIDADQIVATNGAMEAVHLSLRAVAERGDVIAVESPTFFWTLQLLEHLGLRALELPTDPHTGVVLDQLELALRRHTVKACLFSPNFQNPTGSCMTDDQKQRLVRLLAHHEIPLIEDDIYGELPFTGDRPCAARAYDRDGLVLWCGSLSKSLAPGLRAGWVAGGRYHARIEQLKSIHTVTSAPWPLMVAAEFLEMGQFERHLRRMREVIRQNVVRLTDAIADCFPTGTRAAEPVGGMVLWVELPEGVDALRLQRDALDHGIGIAPGPIFSPSGRYTNCVRMNAAMVWSDRIERAVAQVGLLARQQLR